MEYKLVASPIRSAYKDSQYLNPVPDGVVTADKITVDDLAAINADMGAITAGTITLNTTGHIKSGQTAYATGTGWWIGIDSGTAKFSFGNASKYVRWNGSDLSVGGDIITTSNLQSATVTSTTASYSNSATTFTKPLGSSTEQTLVTISSISVTNGESVLLTFGFYGHMTCPIDAGGEVQVMVPRVYRDSTIIFDGFGGESPANHYNAKYPALREVWVDTGSSGNDITTPDRGFFSFSYVDTPSTGTYSYVLKVVYDNSPNDTSSTQEITNKFLSVTVLKR